MNATILQDYCTSSKMVSPMHHHGGQVHGVWPVGKQSVCCLAGSRFLAINLLISAQNILCFVNDGSTATGLLGSGFLVFDV